MTTRNKLQIPINEPTTVELLFDEPITGTSSYGEYFMYAVKSGGEEYSYFAPEEVHEKLKLLSRGDQATITKLAAQRGDKLVTTYEVKSDRLLDEQANVYARRGEEMYSSPSDKPDKYYDVMLSSYKDAIEINDQLKGMADVSKIAVTLFIARSKVR